MFILFLINISQLRFYPEVAFLKFALRINTLDIT